MNNIFRSWHGVYVYTTDVKKTLGRFKVGKADRKALTIEDAAMIRINEQFTAGNRDEKVELMHVFNADDVAMRSIDLEGKLHKILRPYWVGGEWFETGDLKPIIAAYNKLTTNVQRPNNYTLRKEQNAAVELAYKYFTQKRGTMFLFNAIMRFGKTFAAYSLMKKLAAKRVLILTYKPAVGDSWQSDLLDEVKFEGYEFLDAREFSKNNPINIKNKENFVLFSSFQDILGKNLSGNPKEKWQKAIKEHFDLVIIDEVHYGFPSDKAQTFLKTLKYTYRLDLSGTPINLISSGYYDEDQIYSWSYIDEQLSKNADPKNESYKWLPRINLYTYKISDEILRYIDAFDENERLTLNKFFGASDEFLFNHDASVQAFLDNLATPEPRFLRSPFNDDEIKKHLKHMYWYMTSINSVKAMARKLKDHSFFKQYKIVVAAGDNDGERGDTLELVRDAIFKVDNQIADGKGYIGTITISCGKLNTGVTVPKWNSVFFLNELESVQTYWQAAFRGKSPNKADKKTEAYVFDFNPNRALNMMYNFAEENGSSTTSNISVIRRLLDTMRVMAYDGNQLIKSSVEELLNSIVEVGADAMNTIVKFDRDWLFNKSATIDERMVAILSQVGETSRGKLEALDVAKDEHGKGKTFSIQINRGEKGPVERKLFNEMINRARTITSVIPNFLFVSEKNEERVEDIYETEEKEMFQDICGVNVEDFKYLVENGLINKYKINKAIESYHLRDRNSQKCISILEKIERQKKDLKFLNSPSSSEVYTPLELVEEMLDKLPKEIWKNPDLTWCDPCTKSGIFILEVIIRLMKNLKIGDETFTYNHIINNMVSAYVNVERNKWLVSKIVYGSTREKDRVKILEINKIKKEMPKFDVVCGNPPYQWSSEDKLKQRRNNRENLWSRFLFLSYEELLKNKGYLSLIIPSSWMSPSKDFANKSIIKDIFQKNEILLIDLDCKKYFNVGSTFSYFILRKNNNNIITSFKNNEEIFKVDIKNYDYFPIIFNKIVFNISNKFFTNKKFNFLGQTGLQMRNVQYFDEYNENEPTYNIKAYHTAAKKGYKYFNNKSNEHSKRKVLISLSGKYNAFVDDIGDLSQTCMNMVYILNNKEKGKSADQVFNSKIFKFIIDKAYKYTGWINGSIIMNLPFIDLSRSWTDQKLYEYFNLTQEEIDYIESQVK